jgi:D-inositol-3-phosphate glycosyltransferase
MSLQDPYGGRHRRIAVLSVHTSPLAPLGSGSAGGMNVYIRELSRELDNAGYYVDVFTRRADENAPEITHFSRRARVIQVDAGPAEDCPKEAIFDYLPEFVCNVRQFVDSHSLDYDLVHTHYWLSGWAGWLLKKWWNVPMVHMFHTLGLIKNSVAEDSSQLETERRIQVERLLCQVADGLVAASPTDKDDMVSLYEASAQKVTVIPCGVNLDLFSPIDKQLARSIIGQEQGRIVLFVGRIEPLKGLPTLIEAIRLLVAAGPEYGDVRTLVIGGGPPDLESGVPGTDDEVARLRQMVESSGLVDNIRFLGTQGQENLRYFYSAADVCVVPSRYESFGLVALEAMACGTPVIASEVGGLKSTVLDGLTGFLIPDDTPQALANKLSLVLSDSALRSRLGKYAAVKAREYSWPLIAGRLLDLYDSLIGPGEELLLPYGTPGAYTSWND